jgi:pimeloyl-ACP methyl ester carboxylesterase
MSTRESVSGLPGQADNELARLDAMAIRHRIAHGAGTVVWREFGEGPPLVLLHGGHGNWMHWARSIDALSARHTLLVPDLPGFGDSDPLPGPVHDPDRLERLVETVIGTLNQLVGGKTPVALAGFSFGGLAAAFVAARRPNIGRLALLGPGGHGGARRPGAALIDWRTEDPVAMRRALRHNLEAHMLHDRGAVDDLAMAIHERACKATRFRSKAISRQALLRDALAGYTGPTLLMWGEHDVTAVPMEVAQQLAHGEGHRDWCVIPGAGHWVQFERHREVNPLLLRWFGDAQAR